MGLRLNSRTGQFIKEMVTKWSRACQPDSAVVKERSARQHHTLQYMQRVSYIARCLSRKYLYTSNIIVLRWHHHESLAGSGHTRDTCHVSPTVTCPKSLPAPAAGRGKHDGSHKRVLRDFQIRVRVATKNINCE